MGFSLQAFINELYSVMGENIPSEEKLEHLKNAIKAGAKYAAECGQIELHE